MQYNKQMEKRNNIFIIICTNIMVHVYEGSYWDISSDHRNLDTADEAEAFILAFRLEIFNFMTYQVMAYV